jgi:hypothetical protein
MAFVERPTNGGRREIGRGGWDKQNAPTQDHHCTKERLCRQACRSIQHRATLHSVNVSCCRLASRWHSTRTRIQLLCLTRVENALVRLRFQSARDSLVRMPLSTDFFRDPGGCTPIDD